MSPVGRVCALGAAVIAVVTLAFWNSGTPHASESRPLDGAQLFHAKGCASCHDGPDTTASINVAPSLGDADEWAGARRTDMTARAYLTESINEPGAFISPAVADGSFPTMPNLNLTSDEIDALVDHLLSK